MSEVLTFTTAAKRAEPILFILDGEEYKFVPQKLAPVALAQLESDTQSQMKSMLDWLGNGLGEEQSGRILNRLKDPNDDLDLVQLTKIISGLVEVQAGRPSGSQRG